MEALNLTLALWVFTVLFNLFFYTHGWL